jgi:hypothetical protein
MSAPTIERSDVYETWVVKQLGRYPELPDDPDEAQTFLQAKKAEMQTRRTELQAEMGRLDTLIRAVRGDD